MSVDHDSTDVGRWQRRETLLDALLALDVAEREARLAERAWQDPEEAAAVRGWLVDIERSDGFLETAAPTPPIATLHLHADMRVGVWRLLRPLGRGGMGEVWLAERADGAFEKRVAIKFLRIDTPGLRERLQHERRVLARLEHPGIARLLDGGVALDGQPYLVTEFVDGIAVDAWCAEHRANLGTRLAVFHAIAAAVAYAHVHLVVHRDIKPANILVDRAGQPRLLDFGIAKLIDPMAATETIERPLTPQFAAPEQLTGAAVTTATDVYALGALLYLLLSGVPPLQTAGLPLALLARRVCEDLPAPPSVRAALPEVPAAMLRGDLDAITLKALSKRPQERYASIDALLADMDNAAAHRPVAAHSVARGYRVRCFVRRHRWPLAIATMLLAALFAGLAGTLWQAHRAAAERDVALAERNRAREESDRNLATVDFMSAMLGDAAPNDEAVHVSDLLARTDDRLLRDSRMPPARRSALIAALADIHARRRDPQGTERLLLPLLSTADPTLSTATAARTACYLAEAERDLGKLAEARHWAKVGLQRSISLIGEAREEHAGCVSVLALIAQDEGNLDQALNLHRQAITEADAYNGAAAESSVGLHTGYGYSLQLAGRLREARTEHKRALEILEQRGRADTIDAAIAMASIAAGDQDMGLPMQADVEITRANAIYRRTSGASTGLAIQLMRSATIKIELADAQAALALLDESAAMQPGGLGERSLFSAQMAFHRGRALALLGRTEQARAQFAQTQTLYDKLLPAQSPYRDALRMAQAEMLLDTGADARSARAALGMLATTETDLRALGRSGQARLSRNLLDQAEAALLEGDLATASGRVSEARTLFANNADADAWQIAACDAVLAKIRLQRGESAGARELLNSAATRLQNALGATHPRTLAARTPVSPPARAGFHNAAEAAAATH